MNRHNSHTFLGGTSRLHSVFTALVAAIHVGTELLEITSHQLVKALVSGRVLHEPCLIAEAVEAIISEAVEVALVIPVAACRKLAVLVKAEFQIARWNSLILGVAANISGNSFRRLLGAYCNTT